MASEEKHYRAVKLRLYPTPEQQVLIEKTFGCCRFVYNHYLAQKIKFWKEQQKSVSWIDCQNHLSKKLKPKHTWLQDVSSQALIWSLRHLDRTYRSFMQGSGFPKFKSKRESCQSYTEGNNSRLKDGRLWLPKLGSLYTAGANDRLLQGRLKSVTVSKIGSGKYFVSALFEIPESVALCKGYQQPLSACGIDFGVVQPLTIANQSRSLVLGKHEREKLILAEKRRQQYQKQFSRKKKGSKNQAKARIKVARAYERESNIRREFQEQTSCLLAKTFKKIIVEDLKLSKMTRQVCRTKDGSPRKNVSAKAGLNRELLRIGYSYLVVRLAAKCKKFGGELVKVSPMFTSQTCSACSHIDKQSRESQSRFRCTSCGFKLNADVNAARNILNKGI